MKYFIKESSIIEH